MFVYLYRLLLTFFLSFSVQHLHVEDISVGIYNLLKTYSMTLTLLDKIISYIIFFLHTIN